MTVSTKLISLAAASTLPATIFAGLAQMSADMAALAKNASSQPGMDRSVVGMLGDQIAQIDGYGCWCYFEENHGRGKSQPVNDVDSYCKQLHEGYDCAMIDAEESGLECVPWESDYNSSPSSEDTLVSDCIRKNPDDECAKAACIVEGNFISKVFRAFISGTSEHSSTFLHSEGFIVDDNCPTQQGIQSEKSCCGEWPTRHPFKTYDGERGCCGSKTFDKNVLTCCDDNRARLSC